MSYIYKNILEGTAWTEIIPLNTIDTFETITISNTGADAYITMYLYNATKTVTNEIEAQGVNDTIGKFFVLKAIAMTSDVTLVLDTGDFAFDNTLYSLRFETTTSADIIINATPSGYKASVGLDDPMAKTTKWQNYTDPSGGASEKIDDSQISPYS